MRAARRAARIVEKLLWLRTFRRPD